jgi:hypothetical protein
LSVQQAAKNRTGSGLEYDDYRAAALPLGPKPKLPAVGIDSPNCGEVIL